jgi:hypothetical protein
MGNKTGTKILVTFNFWKYHITLLFNFMVQGDRLLMEP